MYSKNDGKINVSDLTEFCPAVLLELSKVECQRKAEGEEHHHEHHEHDGNEEEGKGMYGGAIC